MKIFVNEIEHPLPAGITAGTLRARCKPTADILIVNGFPADPGQALEDGDRVVLIRRGEVRQDSWRRPGCRIGRVPDRSGGRSSRLGVGRH